MPQKFKQGSPPGSVPDILQDFQVAESDLVQDHVVLAGVELDLPQVAQGIEMRTAKILQNCPAGPDAKGFFRQAGLLSPQGTEQGLQVGAGPLHAKAVLTQHLHPGIF